jgi:hypothetical protein
MLSGAPDRRQRRIFREPDNGDILKQRLDLSDITVIAEKNADLLKAIVL